MAIYKRCANCHKLFEGKHCPECTKKAARKRYREKQSQQLYSQYKWRQCRKNAIIHYQAIDIWLLAIGKTVVCKEPVVHHIVEVEDAPEFKYRLDNLITVTADSHAQIHEMYNKDKPAALKRIADGIKKFNETYGDEE